MLPTRETHVQSLFCFISFPFLLGVWCFTGSLATQLLECIPDQLGNGLHRHYFHVCTN